MKRGRITAAAPAKRRFRAMAAAALGRNVAAADGDDLNANDGSDGTPARGAGSFPAVVTSRTIFQPSSPRRRKKDTPPLLSVRARRVCQRPVTVAVPPVDGSM